MFFPQGIERLESFPRPCFICEPYYYQVQVNNLTHTHHTYITTRLHTTRKLDLTTTCTKPKR
jgi:hypothetical protein